MSLIDTPALFAEYAEYHQDPVNRLTHYIGLPLGGIAVFGGLGKVLITDVNGAPVTLGLIAIVAFVLFSMIVDVRLALLSALPAITFYAIGTSLPIVVLAGLLVLGLGIPIAGHVVWEKRWPDTLARLGRFEVVGHMWFLNQVLQIIPSQSAQSPAHDPTA